MSGITLSINGQQTTVDDVDPSTPLLWVLRDSLGLVGTKYGCGIGQCSSCLVHIDGEPRRSCIVSLSSASGKEITTIEGLAKNDELTVVQQSARIDTLYFSADLEIAV